MFSLFSAHPARQHMMTCLLAAVTLLILMSPNTVPLLAQIDDCLACISIPTLQIASAPVVEAYITPDGTTWDVSQLHMTVGHMQRTAWFGEGGNIRLGAHSIGIDGDADIFYNLNSLQIGADIFVETASALYTYRVTEIRRVHQTEIDILLATPTERLTMFTCVPDSYNSTTGQYVDRFVVIAERVS